MEYRSWYNNHQGLYCHLPFYFCWYKYLLQLHNFWVWIKVRHNQIQYLYLEKIRLDVGFCHVCHHRLIAVTILSVMIFPYFRKEMTTDDPFQSVNWSFCVFSLNSRLPPHHAWSKGSCRQASHLTFQVLNDTYPRVVTKVISIRLCYFACFNGEIQCYLKTLP